MVLPINSPIIRDPIGDDNGNGNFGPGSGRRPPRTPEAPGFEDFQVEIPDWLQRFSEEGYGAGFMRDVLQLGGTPLASKANVMQRQLAENPFLQGVSGSGFAQKQIESLGVEKSKQLSSLQLGAEQKNLGIQRGALARLRELERFNEQIERDWRNMNQMERFQAQQRKFQLEAALNAYDQQQGPGAGMQFGAFLSQIAPLAL
jgi:hypothetical protein